MNYNKYLSYQCPLCIVSSKENHFPSFTFISCCHFHVAVTTHPEGGSILFLLERKMVKNAWALKHQWSSHNQMQTASKQIPPSASSIKQMEEWERVGQSYPNIFTHPEYQFPSSRDRGQGENILM